MNRFRGASAQRKKRKPVGGMNRSTPAQQEWRQRGKAQAEWLGCSVNDFWHRPTPEKSVAVRERRKRMTNLGDTPIFEMVRGKDGVYARTQVGVKAWSA